MKTKEIYETIGCGEFDNLRRRVTNTSSDTVNITAEELEHGVSLEKLETVNTPVYRYQTQITIHGIVPDFNPHSRPGGYKSLIANKNGTLGVRYSAIDAEKKRLIATVLRESKVFFVNQTSTEFTILKTFSEKADALAAINKLRTLQPLFYGEITAGCMMYGGYFVGIELFAVRQENVWPLLAELGAPASQEEYDKVMEEKRLAEQAQEQARQAEHDERMKVQTATHEQDKLNYSNTHKRVTALTYPLNCLRLSLTTVYGARVRHYKLIQKGGRTYNTESGEPVIVKPCVLAVFTDAIEKGLLFYEN